MKSSWLSRRRRRISEMPNAHAVHNFIICTVILLMAAAMYNVSSQ